MLPRSRRTEIFLFRGARVVYVELVASQEERLRRNETEFRLAEKPFKRDLAESRCHLLEAGAKYRLNSTGEHEDRPDYIRIDDNNVSAEGAAERIIAAFDLPRRG